MLCTEKHPDGNSSSAKDNLYIYIYICFIANWMGLNVYMSVAAHNHNLCDLSQDGCESFQNACQFDSATDLR